jgi:hypothetical protein
MRKLCDWSNFAAYTRDLETMWQNGTPPFMAQRSTSVATRKPGEAKSRRREKEVTLCPSPLDALSYTLSLASLRNIAVGHGDEARFFARKSQKLGTFQGPPPPLVGGGGGGGGRLRVGYVSIELRDRPVGKDMVYAFKAQNEEVDVVCFSLNPSPRAGVNGVETLSWHQQMVSIHTHTHTLNLVLMGLKLSRGTSKW